ncbi:MAG: hypothetical protein KKD32_20130 [Proteobacteria bacterium]|nr:hypothetical protein [Pseudomonadota bacterium]
MIKKKKKSLFVCVLSALFFIVGLSLSLLGGLLLHSKAFREANQYDWRKKERTVHII